MGNEEVTPSVTSAVTDGVLTPAEQAELKRAWSEIRALIKELDLDEAAQLREIVDTVIDLLGRFRRKDERAMLATLLLPFTGLDETAPVTDVVTDETVRAFRARIEILEGDVNAYRQEHGPLTRLCACGCGWPVPSPRPEARYATAACRVRAYRAR
jgi:hypothetical protein